MKKLLNSGAECDEITFRLVAAGTPLKGNIPAEKFVNNCIRAAWNNAPYALLVYKGDALVCIRPAVRGQVFCMRATGKRKALEEPSAFWSNFQFFPMDSNEVFFGNSSVPEYGGHEVWHLVPPRADCFFNKTVALIGAEFIRETPADEIIFLAKEGHDTVLAYGRVPL